MKGTFIEFSPGQKFATRGAATSDTPDQFMDAGYKIEEDEIIIDIDSMEKDTIKALINTMEIKTQIVWTDRGAHIYFKKPENYRGPVNGVCAMGFTIETKTSRAHYITVKRNGVMRTIENEDKRDMLPWWLRPSKKYKVNMLGMSDGDGRNNALFAHRMALGNEAETTKIVTFINSHVFADPLKTEEVDNILKATPTTETRNVEREMAESIIDTRKAVIWQGKVYWMSGDEYITDPDDRRLKQLVYMLNPECGTRFVKEVTEMIHDLCESKDGAIFPIRVANGYFYEGTFVAGTCPTFTPYFIDINYNPNAKPVQIVDDYLDNITGNDKDYRMVLEEAIGYPLILDPEIMASIGKFFFLRGDGANGKGTLLKIMRRIYGRDNCTQHSPKEIGDHRYACTMPGKLVNLGDDIDPSAIKDDAMRALKNIATADIVSLRALYKVAEAAQITSKLFFSCNHDIRTFEKGYAVKRRIMWLPMFTKIDKPDPKFESHCTTKECLEYWLRLMVEGYQRLLDNGRFTDSQIIRNYNEEYHKYNNYMAQFLELLDLETDVIGHSGKEIQVMYDEQNDNKQQPYNPKLLKDALAEKGIISAVKKIMGKSCRVYVWATETVQTND